MHMTNRDRKDTKSGTGRRDEIPKVCFLAFANIKETSIEIVEEWLMENSVAIRDGGCGDVQMLLALLWDSWKNVR